MTCVKPAHPLQEVAGPVVQCVIGLLSSFVQWDEGPRRNRLVRQPGTAVASHEAQGVPLGDAREIAGRSEGRMHHPLSAPAAPPPVRR